MVASVSGRAAAVESETTPLLRDAERGSSPTSSTTSTLTDSQPGQPTLFSPLRRVLITAFFLAIAFAYTQASLIYAFRKMTCEDYYESHEPYTGGGDRCSIAEIEASSARSIAIMGVTTTTCSIINVFVTGWWIKTFGVQAAMFQQTAWAALRNLTQIYALKRGGALGILIIQSTQVINIIGSGGGYQLAANAYIAILCAPEDRTKTFGILTGTIMAGMSAAYTLGGLTEYYMGPLAPFQVTFTLLVAVTILGRLFLPYIDPNAGQTTGKDGSPPAKRSFLAPLKIFAPRKRRRTDGRIRRDWNLFFLGAGAFLSVLATGMVPLALQLLGTNVFGWLPAQSGLMLSLTLLVRAFFLTGMFPRIIAFGRRRYAKSSPSTSPPTPPSTTSFEHPEDPNQLEPATMSTSLPPPKQAEQPPTSADNGAAFDLVFLRSSMLLDGALTALMTFATQGWHIFAAAVALPFASGTGPAAKGVVLDFVEPDLRADALSAIALVEKLATISTTGFFGYIFALLSEVHRPTLVFTIDAAVALLAGLLLFVVRVPEKLLSFKEEEDDDGEHCQS